MIEEAIDTRPFRFSAIVDEAYQDILPTLLELEDRLNEDIQLSDYTDAIETIYFIPMILDDQTDYEERLEYDEESKEVFLQVFASDEDEFSELLAASFLCLQKTLEEELINEDFANALNVGNNPDKR
jgi:phosphorylcholine metabolism protein LicD